VSVSTLDTRSSIGIDAIFGNRAAARMRGLLLGGLTCLVHNDRQGARTLGFGDLGIDLPGSVSVGVSFHGTCMYVCVCTCMYVCTCVCV
jgi:hypothetical protein